MLTLSATCVIEGSSGACAGWASSDAPPGTSGLTKTTMSRMYVHVWTMTMTRMILKLLHLNKAHSNKLESRALVRVTANVRAKFLNQKCHNPQAKVKTTFGKPLK